MNKEILHRKLKNLGIFLIIGIVYFIWIKLTGLAIPCMTRKITGLKCSGCGATTMVVCFAKLDFKGAFDANQFLFCSIPFLIFEIIFVNMREVYEKKNPMWNKVLLIIYLAMFIAFGVLRNFI